MHNRRHVIRLLGPALLLVLLVSITYRANAGNTVSLLTLQLVTHGPGPLVQLPALAQGELAAPTMAKSRLPIDATMIEDFEAAWPAAGWQVFDGSDADGGEYTWNRRACHPHTGALGGWAIGGGAQGSTLSCDATYPANVNTWAIYGPVDLSRATAASLSFHVWGRSQTQGSDCADFLYVGSFTNETDLTGNAWCGNATGGSAGNGYYRLSLDLDDRLGAEQVWIAFVFVSDESVSYEGFTIDDISLDVTGAAPLTMAKTYLPLLLAPSGGVPPLPTATATPTPTRTATPTPTETPDPNSAFNQVQQALTTQGNGAIFGLDTSQCTFDSASLYVYAGPQPCSTPQPWPSSDAEREVLERMDDLYFRAGYGLLKADITGYPLTDATYSYPDPNRLRITFNQGTTLRFTGEVVQNEMRVAYSESGGNSYNDQCQYYLLDGQFTCPVQFVPRSEWSPLPVSNVVIQNLPNRCIRVSWRPAPAGIPGAEPVQYSLRLSAGGTSPYLNDVRAPGNVTTYDDCTEVATRQWYCGTFQDTVFAIAANGKQSSPAYSNIIMVCMRP